jgi:hypothetical protein
VTVVDVLHHLQLVALLVGREVFAEHVFDRLIFDVIYFEAGIAYGRALVDSVQKGRRPVLRAAMRERER